MLENQTATQIGAPFIALQKRSKLDVADTSCRPTPTLVDPFDWSMSAEFSVTVLWNIPTLAVQINTVYNLVLRKNPFLLPAGCVFNGRRA